MIKSKYKKIDKHEGKMNDYDFENFEYLTKLLINMGITPDKLGFEYLRKAILMAVNDPTYLQAVTKRLYPDIAKDYGVKPRDVERCIRFAIGYSYNCGGLLEINNLYKSVVYKNDYKTTNSELIGIIADKIIMDTKKRGLA